jgi:hypothetical protein
MTPLFQGREVAVSEIDGFLDLIDESVANKYKRDGSLDEVDAGRFFRIGVGIEKKLDQHAVDYRIISDSVRYSTIVFHMRSALSNAYNVKGKPSTRFTGGSTARMSGAEGFCEAFETTIEIFRRNSIKFVRCCANVAP